MSGLKYHDDFKSPFPDPTNLQGRQGPYHPPPGLIAAANAAFVLKAPLLLTGEPGSGKTDFAYVVRNALSKAHPEREVDLFACHVRSDTRARDLLYHFDALRRFGDAQHGTGDDRKRAADPREYVHLNGLGRGLLSPEQTVVLIDEIDKAPRDLPNDLLRELDRERGEFAIPEIDEDIEKRLGQGREVFGRPLARVMRREDNAPMPFVVITSNAERQLPEPFLRRCVFFHIDYPDKEQLLTIVRERNRRRGPEGLTSEPLIAANLLEPAVKIFRAFRTAVSLTKPPSTAELLNWMEVLGTVYDPRTIRAELKGFASCIDDVSLELTRSPTMPWGELPGIHCLVKLEEDAKRLEESLEFAEPAP